ncbi:DUF2170 family protein [Halomonas sp. V046]|uniref:DUF2170 family protein n=1 Tax=Halomonas sp. V046 TaxID=3459611 RepID=UPI004043C338
MNGIEAFATFNTRKFREKNLSAFCVDTTGELIQINVEEFPDVPVYLSSDEEQSLFFYYLFNEDEVDPRHLNELNEQLLQLSINIPLCAIGKIRHRYVVFAALSLDAQPAAAPDAFLQQAVAVAESTVELLYTFESFLVTSSDTTG